jgi:hypothetical protein
LSTRNVSLFNFSMNFNIIWAPLVGSYTSSTVNLLILFIKEGRKAQLLLNSCQKKQYWFDVKMSREEVRKQFAKLDVRPHKDAVFTHIRCNENTNIEQLIALAEQAYESTQ